MQFDQLLKQSVCLYASFDAGPDAHFSRGAGEATLNTGVVRHDPAAGRFGGALVFNAKEHGWAEDECTFAARDTFPYRDDGSPFAGTVSLWLKGDPDADLSDEYPVDPFHVSRHPADGSFYLDQLLNEVERAVTAPAGLALSSKHRRDRLAAFGENQ